MSSSMAERDRLDELRGRGVLSLKQYLITEISRNISRKKVRFGCKRFPEKWVETSRNPWVGQLVGGTSGHKPGPR